MQRLTSITALIRHRIDLLAILFLALVLRLYNFSDRLWFGPDQGRDALIGLESIATRHIPLLGPPSSAWGFNFGPLYYHLISLFHMVLPGALAPWIGFLILSILAVGLFYHLGQLLGGRVLAILLGLLTAINIPSLHNAGNLLNTVLAMYATFFVIYLLHLSLTKGRPRVYIFFGLALGLAVNSHLQSLFLLSLPVLATIYLLWIRRDWLRFIGLTGTGLILAFLPLMVFEYQHNLAWIKSLIDYSLVGQYQFYVPIRWLTEVTVFWPQLFGSLTVGLPMLGYPLTLMVGVVIIVAIYKRQLPITMLVLLVCLFLEVINIRYYRGPRSAEYFLTLVPFFLIFIGWSLWYMTQLSRVLAGILIAIILVSTLPQIWITLNSSTGSSQIIDFADKLKGQQTALYLTPRSEMAGHSLGYLLHYSDHLSLDGVPLVLCYSRHQVDICQGIEPMLEAGEYSLIQVEPSSQSAELFRPEIFIPRLYNNYQLIKY
jgi:hypothetical protein